MRIDVVIPVRNGELFIQRALMSVRAQSFKVNKIIVVNDGSTDGTEEIVRSQWGYGDDLVLVSNQPTGLSNARNTGIKLSNADFIALLDCDDLWTESKLLNQVKHLESHEICRVIFSNYSTFSEGSEDLESGSKNTGYQCSLQNVLMQNFRVLGSASSALIERELLMQVGLFDENLKYGEDYDLWTRLSQLTELCEVADEDVMISVRSNSMQNQQEKGLNRFKNSLMYLEVWSKNEFDILDRKKSQRLIWPDLRRSLFENPFNLFIFEKKIRHEFKSTYDLIYRNRMGYILAVAKMSLSDVHSYLTRLLQRA